MDAICCNRKWLDLNQSCYQNSSLNACQLVCLFPGLYSEEKISFKVSKTLEVYNLKNNWINDRENTK